MTKQYLIEGEAAISASMFAIKCWECELDNTAKCDSSWLPNDLHTCVKEREWLEAREYKVPTGKLVTEYIPACDIDGELVYKKVVTCSECGKTLKATSEYCHMCGVKLVKND